MKKTVLGIIIAASSLWASYSFAVFCPPVPGDNTENLRACNAWAAATDKMVILGDILVMNQQMLQQYRDSIRSVNPIPLPVNNAIYPISGQVEISAGVSLIGSGSLWGTQILVNFGKNYSNTDSANAALVLKDYASVDGITFNYPDQIKGKQLYEFPPTVSVQGSFCRVKNSFFPNSYIGIDATVPHGKLNMQNLEFGIFYRGIRDDQCYDIDKLDVIHANPGMFATWVDDSEVNNWMYNNSALFEVSRIDWFYVNQFFSFGTKYGILINSFKNGSVGESQIIQGGCDACQYGIYSNITDGSRPWLLTISNWSGTAFNPVNGKDTGTSIFLAHVQGVNISNSNFWGVRNDGIHLEDCSSVVISGNNYIHNGWNSADNGSSAIHLINCSRAGVTANTGSSDRQSAYGIRIEGGNNISLSLNMFEIPSSSVSIENNASHIIAIGNQGCIQDMTQEDSNRILDLPCDPSSRYTPTPVSTRTPMPTPTPTRNPTDPTPTPTPTPIPTRPVKIPGRTLM